MRSSPDRDSQRKGQLVSKSEASLQQSEGDRLQTSIDHFIMKLERERREGAILDRSIEQLEQQFLAKKEEAKETGLTRKLMLQISVLQRKQQLALARVGEIRAENRMIKLRIDDVRRELQSCQGVIARVSGDIESSSSKATLVNDLSRRCSRVAERARYQVQILRSKSVHERLNYASRFQEISEVIQKDSESKSSYLRQVEDLFQEVLKRPVDHLDLSPVQQALFAKWRTKLQAKQSEFEDYIKRIRTLTEALEQIRDATGISSVKEVVTGFIKSEEQQYALYRHVDDLTSEIDTLDLSLVRNRKLIDGLKSTGGDVMLAKSIHSQSQDSLSALQHRLQETQRILDSLRDALHTAQTPAWSLYEMVLSASSLFSLPHPIESAPSLLQITGEVEDRLEVMLSAQPTEASSVQWSLDQLSPKKFAIVKPSVPLTQVQAAEVPEESELNHIKIPLTEALFRQRQKRKHAEEQTPSGRSKSASHFS